VVWGGRSSNLPILSLVPCKLGRQNRERKAKKMVMMTDGSARAEGGGGGRREKERERRNGKQVCQ
jgi:hypothetical protein